MRYPLPGANRGLDLDQSGNLPVLYHMEHFHPSSDAAANVPGLLHIQFAAVSVTMSAYTVDLVDLADCLQHAESRTDGG